MNKWFNNLVSYFWENIHVYVITILRMLGFAWFYYINYFILTDWVNKHGVGTLLSHILIYRGSIICYSDLLIKKTRRKFLVLAIFSKFYRMTTYIIIPNELTSQHVVSGEFWDSRIVVNQSDCSVVTVIWSFITSSRLLSHKAKRVSYISYLSTWLSHSWMTPSRRQWPQR